MASASQLQEMNACAAGGETSRPIWDKGVRRVSNASDVSRAAWWPGGRAEAYRPGPSASRRLSDVRDGEPRWKLRAGEAKGRRAAALFFSIRSLMVISSVLGVGGAVAFTWAITYLFSARSLESVARLLVAEAHAHTAETLHRQLERLVEAAEAQRGAFELALLTKDDWRTTLASFMAALNGSFAAGRGSGPGPGVGGRSLRHVGVEEVSGVGAGGGAGPHFETLALFPERTALGVERCGADEAAAGASPTAFPSFFSIGAPPARRPALGPDAAGSDSPERLRGRRTRPAAGSAGPPPAPPRRSGHSSRAELEALLVGPESALFTDVVLQPARRPNATAAAGRAAVVYATRAVAQAGLAGARPAGLPAPLGERYAAAEAAAGARRPAGDPLGSTIALIAAAMDTGALSAQLRAALPTPDSLAFLVSSAGQLIASSSAPAAPGGPRRPLDSPRPDVAQEAQRAAAGPEGRLASADVEGATYYLARRPVARRPNLEWELYLAAPRGTLLAGINASTVVNLVVNSLWLVLSVCVAAALGVRITRPLVALRRSMVQLAQTMTAVARELELGEPPQAAGPPGQPPPAPSAAPPEQQPQKPLGRRTARGRRGRCWGGCAGGRGGRCGGRRAWRRRRPHGATSRGSVALGSGLRELEAFEEAVRAMRSGFAAFREMSATELALMRSLLAERKTKLEMEVRADETRKFISTMSHEMRTPLNGILGMLQLARDCTLPAEAAEFVEAASLSGEHLLSIVNDVLDLQKIEAGLIELQSGPMRVAEIVPASPSLSRARRGAEGRGAGRQVEASVRIVAPRASAKGLLLAAVIADDVPAVVVGDADRTRQCLLNLVSKWAPAPRLPAPLKPVAAARSSTRCGAPSRRAPGPARPPAGRPAGAAQARRAQVRVTVEAEAADAVVVDASRFLKFAVLDSGPGIALEARQQLFTRFYRVQHDPARGADPGGTGLGLAISREIVTKMGGEIGCASEVGRGSTFYFTVPLRAALPGGAPLSPATLAVRADFEAGGARPDALLAAPPASLLAVLPATPERHPTPAPPAPASSVLLRPASEAGGCTETARTPLSAPSSPGPPRGGPGVARPAPGPAAAAALSILVVEDHAMNLRVLRTMLEKVGHRVTEARNGREAVEAFEAAAAPDCFHLVFMDCSMPVMDGFEATRRIRALERARGWRRHFIVALTGHASTEDGAACLSAGMDKWLTKPIRKSVLLETIEALTGAAPRSGPERSPSPSPSALLRPRSTPLAAASTRVLFMPTLRRVRSDSQCSPPSRGPDGRPPPLNAAPGPPPIELPPAAVEEAAAPPAGGAGRRAAERGERWAPSLTPPPSMSDAGDRERFLSVCSAGECAGAGIGAGIGARGRWGRPRRRRGPRWSGRRRGRGRAPAPRAMNRRVLKALLAREGHRVQVAEDGEEAVEVFARRLAAPGPPGAPAAAPFDIVFMDVSMPRLDGIGATRRIRELERGRPGAAPRTFIVACTALSSSQDHANVLEAGMQELLVKPVTRAGILAMLANAAAGAAAFAGPPASPLLRSGHGRGTLPWARRRCGAGRGGRERRAGRRSSAPPELLPTAAAASDASELRVEVL
eukprot:tig00000140_g8473.t1